MKDSTNAEMYEAYLKKYPRGEFASLAEAKLAELHAIYADVEAGRAAATSSIYAFAAGGGEEPSSPGFFRSGPPLRGRPKQGGVGRSAQLGDPLTSLLMAELPTPGYS